MKNRYKLINHVNELFEDTDLSDTLFISCQHLLGTQYKMFEQLFKQGLQKQNCFIIGKNYSTNITVYEQLKALGCYVDGASIEYCPTQSFDEWFSERLKKFLSFVLASIDIESFRKIVLLDDGGMLIHEASQYGLPFEKVGAIEQTSSGWAKLKESTVPFDVFYVARTYAKLTYETPFIAKLCFERIIKHLRERKMEKPKMLIIGNQGYIGKSLQKRFSHKGYDVTGYDIKAGHISEVIGEALIAFDVIIGTTGAQSITEYEISQMKQTVSLISVSSSDREFPALYFRKEGTHLHDDHYLDQRCLVNSGFPITFYGNYHELPPNQIELTCALLLLGVFRASLDDEDDRAYSGAFLSAIMSRLSTMYFQQISKKDYVYEL